MPAMHDDVFNSMSCVLDHLKDRYLRTLPFHMTHAECINLIAPREHIELLTKTAEIAEISSLEAWTDPLTVPIVADGVEHPRVTLLMKTFDQQVPPLRPRAPTWQAHSEISRVAGQKVIDWVAKRLEIGRRFATVKHIVHRLNMDCENGHQLRYMFPAVLHLCKAGRNPRMDKWMEKFSAYKVCKHTPAVSSELKKAIQDSSALLTMVAMLGDDVPEPEPSPVYISMYGMTAFNIENAYVNRM